MSSDDCNNCELCIMTVERSETCYFDRYDTSGRWDYPAGVVDDDIKSYGSIMWLLGIVDYWKPPNSTINCDSISCPTPTDITRVITKVELRGASLSVEIGGGCDWTVHAILEPIFTAGIGDEHAYLPIRVDFDIYAGFYPRWSDWLDITTDTNAPATWTWTDVSSLKLNHFPRYTCATGCGNPCCLMTHMIEIRITWTESVSIRYPEWGEIHGSLSKNIDMFNLWKTTVKTRDNGLNNQAYQLKGLAVSCKSIICFPLCFPFCFIPEMQIAFQTMHDWIENHDEVTITCYGECADGVYIIKNLSTHSTRHPYDYLWTLDLEKVTDS